ncbi:MAG: sigma-70 family RNA polymerase sigma factor [bacterium]|nr:sigma-70 family RNA polymerase sigma factor [bacterium]
MDTISRLKQLNDEELAAEAQAGSRRCFEELVRRYSLRLYHYLRPRIATDQDAEDLVQETFLKVYRNIGRFDSTYKFSTWIYTTATRLVISVYRKKKLDVPGLEDTGPSHPLSDPQERLIREEEDKNLWAAARTLQHHQYQALWLRYTENLSVKEIAVVMKKSRVSVRVLLHRARLNLAKQLNPSAHPGKIAAGVAGEKSFSFL